MKQNSKGFTLIELLVVIAIIGLLSTLAVVSLGGAREKARDGRRVADMSSVRSGLDLYYTDNAKYPEDTNVVFGTDAVSLNADGFDGAERVIMAALPTDPSDPSATCTGSDTEPCDFVYSAVSGEAGQQYEIMFYLEGKTGTLEAGVACATESGIANACIH